MIHYFGTPITPNSACLAAIKGGHAFVSFARPDQLGIAIESCQSFALDNGAFSAWTAGAPVADWADYYAWVGDLARYPSCDFAVIPDLIGGSPADNDALLAEWPHPRIGAPVWHLNSPLDRLARLAADYPRVCLGSAGEFATIGDARWWARINEAMGVLCDAEGFPLTRIHGLRMLKPSVVEYIPFASADSTHIGRSVGMDSKWSGAYAPASKDVRASVLRRRIEAFNSPARWSRQPVQEGLFALPL